MGDCETLFASASLFPAHPPPAIQSLYWRLDIEEYLICSPLLRFKHPTSSLLQQRYTERVPGLRYWYSQQLSYSSCSRLYHFSTPSKRRFVPAVVRSPQLVKRKQDKRIQRIQQEGLIRLYFGIVLGKDKLLLCPDSAAIVVSSSLHNSNYSTFHDKPPAKTKSRTKLP